MRLWPVIGTLEKDGQIPFPRKLQRAIFLFPIGIIIGFAALYLYAPRAYVWFVREDGIVEYAQAAAFFVASGTGFATAAGLREAPNKFPFWLLILFALGALLVGFEEISWGQRIFGYSTPEVIKEINAQGEFTIHNLDPINDLNYNIYIAVGIYGGTAWLLIRNKELSSRDVRRFIIPEWYLSFYFLSVAAFYFVHRYYPLLEGHIRWWELYIIHPEVHWWRHQEVFELLLALGFLFLAIGNYKKSQIKSPITHQPPSFSRLKVRVSDADKG